MYQKQRFSISLLVAASCLAGSLFALSAPTTSFLGGDSDGDGVADGVDLDDDNDGLADSAETPPGPVDIVDWSNEVNGVTASGNAVTYDGTGGPGFTSQINSAFMSTYGFTDDYEVSWRVATDPSGSLSLFGLGATESSASLSDINFALYNAGGTLAIFESGVNLGIFGSVGIGSVLSIQVSGGNVTYRLDGADLLTSSIGGAADLYIDSSFSGNSGVTHDQFQVSPIVLPSADTDGDGVDDSVDLDADNDGVLDIVEAGLTDADNDGLIDAPGDEASVTLAPDSDSDGIADFRDLESGNALNDGTAYDIAGTAFAALDTNGDGMISSLDVGGGVDLDQDGIDDLIDRDPTVYGNPLPDCDGDGVPDVNDTDPDCNMNGVQDNCEAFDDCNMNGIPDECDVDCDMDGIPDDCGDVCAPVADFSFSPSTGRAPLTVQFTDQSTGDIDSWAWDFGDGGTSTQANPTYVYGTPGVFTPSLTVTNTGGSDTFTAASDVVVDPFILGFGDGSFELSTVDSQPSAAWMVVGGTDVNVRANGAIGDAHMPTDGSNWLSVSAAGTDAATPPTNPGGLTAGAVGAAGVSQDFRFSAAAPFLRFEAAFLLNGTAANPSANDFMSVEVTDGSSVYNLYFANSFSIFEQTSPATGFAMTAVENIEADLSALFPSATEATLLTLSVLVGNGGDALEPSVGYFDNVRLEIADHARTRILGCGTNPYGSMRVLGEPSFGEPFTLQYDNPLGTTCAGSIVIPYISNQTVPLSCGFAFPQYGMDGGGSALYVGLAGFLIAQPPILWGGTGMPAEFVGQTMFEASLIGAKFYTQGVFIDVSGACGINIGVTEAAELTLGL